MSSTPLWVGPAIATPRYKAYARLHRRTTYEQVILDELAWEKHGTANFSKWNTHMREVFYSVAPWLFLKGKLSDWDAYDAWLTNIPLPKTVDPWVEMKAVQAHLDTHRPRQVTTRPHRTDVVAHGRSNRDRGHQQRAERIVA